MRIQEKNYRKRFDELFNASVESVKKLGWNLIYQNPEEGKIKAKTDTTLRSWGEDISISIKNLTPTENTISIFSETPYQFIDWGKNEENERRFQKFLERSLMR